MLSSGRRLSIEPPRSGRRERPHGFGAAKADQRTVDDAPALRVDLHRAPKGVAEIEIDAAVELADADEDFPLGRLEAGLRFERVERRLQGLGARRAARVVEKALRQPVTKPSRPDRPCLTVAVHFNVGVTVAVRRVKQFGGHGRVHENVGLACA